MSAPLSVDSLLGSGLVDAFSSWFGQGLRSALTAAIAAAGSTTEPNFQALVTVYDRMLGLSGFIALICLAMAIAERGLGGSQGAGLSVLLRVVAATALAFSGIEIVAQFSAFTSSLSGIWADDSVRRSLTLLRSLDDLGRLLPGPGGLPLILASLLLLALALVVYVELILRSALLLLTTAFIPLVCALSIWPRLAGAGSHLTRFLLALLISKFAIATALEVGLLLISQAQPGALGAALTGVAILLAAAVSPAIVLQGLRHADASGSMLARSWLASGVRTAQRAAVAAAGGPAGAAIAAPDKKPGRAYASQALAARDGSGDE